MKINQLILLNLSDNYITFDEKVACQIASMNFNQFPEGIENEFLNLVKISTQAGYPLHSAVTTNYGKLIIKYLIKKEQICDSYPL